MARLGRPLDARRLSNPAGDFPFPVAGANGVAPVGAGFFSVIPPIGVLAYRHGAAFGANFATGVSTAKAKSFGGAVVDPPGQLWCSGPDVSARRESPRGGCDKMDHGKIVTSGYWIHTRVPTAVDLPILCKTTARPWSRDGTPAGLRVWARGALRTGRHLLGNSSGR